MGEVSAVAREAREVGEVGEAGEVTFFSTDPWVLSVPPKHMHV